MNIHMRTSAYEIGRDGASWRLCSNIVQMNDQTNVILALYTLSILRLLQETSPRPTLTVQFPPCSQAIAHHVRLTLTYTLISIYY